MGANRCIIHTWLCPLVSFMTARRRLDGFSYNVMDVTLENIMVMLCHTANTRSNEQPNRNTCKEGRSLLLGNFLDLHDIQACRKTGSAYGPVRNLQVDAPGGRLCFSFSAFSGSSSDNVYRYREHLILNFVFVLPPATRGATFFIRAAVCGRGCQPSRPRERVTQTDSHTGGILPPGNVDEFLDFADLLGLRRIS
jgi:hypothetical protein